MAYSKWQLGKARVTKAPSAPLESGEFGSAAPLWTQLITATLKPLRRGKEYSEGLGLSMTSALGIQAGKGSAKTEIQTSFQRPISRGKHATHHLQSNRKERLPPPAPEPSLHHSWSETRDWNGKEVSIHRSQREGLSISLWWTVTAGVGAG